MGMLTALTCTPRTSQRMTSSTTFSSSIAVVTICIPDCAGISQQKKRSAAAVASQQQLQLCASHARSPIRDRTKRASLAAPPRRLGSRGIQSKVYRHIRAGGEAPTRGTPRGGGDLRLIFLSYSTLPRATPHQHGGHSLCQDHQVMPESPASDVCDIHTHPLGKTDAAATLHLPDAGEPGGHVEPPTLPAFARIRFIHGQRPRADQCHVSLENVEELRKLIDAGLPQKCTYFGHARIVLDLEGGAVLLVLLGELFLASFGILHHRAEFVDRERPAAQAGALLFEDNFAG